MTPQELFENLCILHPNKYTAASRAEWAKEYGRILAGIPGDTLQEAYNKAKSANKYAPTPNEILLQVPAPEIRPSQIDTAATMSIFKYHDKADHLMRTDAGCRQAVKDGFGLGVYEFIAQHGRTPHIPEWKHIQKTNALFHEQYKACLSGERVPAFRFGNKITEKCGQLGFDGILIEQRMLPMFEAQIKKRNDIAEKYGCN